MVIVHTLVETIVYFPNDWDKYWLSLALAEIEE